ncbi:hypothetical protein GIB67_039667 [Kingdonia uniflora]|uniref:Uncharacterized protein n=1 Tax=Kingdonia uniflora TaxID=39325 RepID=A0A7J7LAS7_9MAGN|nr:hypothetical protein GIB67_039667 [Kingdonia uniflora]
MSLLIFGNLQNNHFSSVVPKQFQSIPNLWIEGNRFQFGVDYPMWDFPEAITDDLNSPRQLSLAPLKTIHLFTLVNQRKEGLRYDVGTILVVDTIDSTYDPGTKKIIIVRSDLEKIRVISRKLAIAYCSNVEFSRQVLSLLIRKVTFSDVVEVFGDDSRIIPLGASLLTSGNYSNVEVKEKRTSHIKNGNKRSTKKRRSVKRCLETFSGEGKNSDSTSNLISNDLIDMTCDIRDKLCNVIHGTRDKSWWLSYGVCKRSRLDLDAPLKIMSGKSELSSYDKCYYIVDNGDVRISLTNDNSLSSDMVQYVSSMARNMFSSQLSDLSLLATFDDDVFEITKEAIALAWDKRQDAYLETCNVNNEIIGVVTSMVDSRAWHEKLGHVSIWMKALFPRRVLDKLKSIDLFFCEDVVLVKLKKVGFPRNRRKLNMGSNDSNHLYDDVWEPIRVSFNGGFHGFIVFIGDSTRELGVHFLKNEIDWFDVFAR